MVLLGRVAKEKIFYIKTGCMALYWCVALRLQLGGGAKSPHKMEKRPS